MELRKLARRTAAALITFATIGASAIASAGTLYPTGYLYPPAEQFGLATGGTSNGSPHAGAFVGTFDELPLDGLPGDPIVFFCVELNQYFSFGGSYEYTESQPDNETFTRLGRLFTSSFGLINNPQSSAAFQLAVWEIYFDTDLSLTNAAGFHVVNNYGHAATVTMAQGWLDNLANSPDTYDVFLLTNSRHQNFVHGTPVLLPDPPPELPEPASVALAAIALLAMFAMLRRRAARARR